jgi:hypothetical protein
MTTPTTEMRMACLATERGGLIAPGAAGGQLRIDGPGQYSIIHANTRAVVVGPNASLATVKAYLAPVDPSIVMAI